MVKNPNKSTNNITQAVFGIVMRRVRKQRGMTQVEVAKALGISQAAVSKIENGILCPSAVDWYKFCVLYDFSPNKMLTEFAEQA